MNVDTYNGLRVKKSELLSMVKSKDFEKSITGFYVRYVGDDNSTSLAIIDGKITFTTKMLSLLSFLFIFLFFLQGVRMGRPYTLPDIKFFTKHLVLSQPPFPKFTAKLLQISDDPFTKVCISYSRYVLF